MAVIPQQKDVTHSQMAQDLCLALVTNGHLK